MDAPARRSTATLDEDRTLRALLESTARETGEAFFRALVRHLAEALGTLGAWVTEYDPAQRKLKALAFQLDGRIIPWERSIDGTPCADVVDKARLVLLPDRLLDYFPNDPDLRATKAVSYMGVPLQEPDGRVMGHLAVIDTRPMPEEPHRIALLRLFAERAAAELRRLHAERQVRDREEQLTGLFGGAMDAILELDGGFRITLANPAAESMLGGSAATLVGHDFRKLLDAEEERRFASIAHEICGETQTRRSAWIPGVLRVKTLAGREFAAEATLSCHHRGDRLFHTLILRDVEQRLAAERRIESLDSQARYLREELRELSNFEGILGRSPALVAVLREIEQVAETDASVLVLGETGTGKELVARAIHQASRRRDGPLVRLNCAAIPASLIESELFGHEKGAFTGATERREGRFALADGGTIFLDEIGELTPELQAKLLRVLQEGEFEPVGSSRTVNVDVRVISATHRDLAVMRKEGRFREDLFYRLSVFPMRVPPLRDRGDDVELLADHFARTLARKLGREAPRLTDESRRRLRSYDWPGNVRELANVVERAVITSRDGRLDLDRAIPGAPAPSSAGAPAPAPTAPKSSPPEATRIRTAAELEALERENLRLALEAAGWKIAGEGGAAQRLGLKPTTLGSRMRALRIERPRWFAPVATRSRRKRRRGIAPDEKSEARPDGGSRHAP
jgi:PAS domain S-box-containing protein